MIVITNLPVWSLGEGKGAPSFYNTLKLYNDKNHNVLLLTTEKNLDLSHLKNISVQSMPKLPLLQSQRLFGSFRLIHKYINYFLYQIMGVIFIIKNIKDHKLIYAYEIGFVPAAKWCGVLKKLPVISRFQGTILTSLAEQTPFLKKLYLKLKFLDHIWAIKTKTAFTIMTDDGTKGLEVSVKLGRKKQDIVFLKNGVDLPKVGELELSSYPKNHQANDIVFSSVSRVQKWKRLDRSIDIFAKVHQAFNNSHYYICGDGPELEKMQAYADSKGLSHAISFLGSLDKSTVYNVLTDSHYFLSSYSLSNLGNPLFEAIRCQNIIVTLNNGDTSKIIQNGVTGIIAEEDDYLSNADQLIADMANTDLRAAMIENANQKLDQQLVTWQQRMDKEYELASQYL